MKTVGTLLCIPILSGFSALRCEARVYHSNGSEASVRACINSAVDGDIVTIPAGTFSWASVLRITKGITLQGETTVSEAGTSRPSVVDRTIIKDELPRTSTTGMIKVGSGVDKKVRITGITFAPGSSTAKLGGEGFITLSGSGGNMNIRLDHCHFDKLYVQKLIWVTGWVYGVADHNYIEVIRNSFPFNMFENAYSGKTFGDGAWADYPWYGTGKFFFIEDNTVVRTNSPIANTLADATQGARYVIRRNYVVNCIPGNHGTESRWRGSRAYEVYDNTFNITVPWSGGGQRSGTSLWHDNVFIGVKPSNGSLCNLAVFREFRPTSDFGQAVGNNIWDANDTEGNGTFVKGHAPHLFESGTATTSAAGGRLIDNTKNWVPNQWAGYSIKRANINAGANIISNTSNTISYYYYTDNTGKFKPLIFNAGHKYQIHKVLIALDQNGRGKGDLLSGNPAINTSTGAANWPHQALEPCYSWNNVYAANGHELGFRSGASGQTTTKPGVDYFNLGGGFPANSTPSAVSSRYTAALNGVDYTGTFVYPHPLVTGAPTPTPSATSRSQQHLQKKEKKQKKAKKKKTRPKKLRE
jgi:hypothetical protein